jgi:hypothetical protein
VVEPAPLQPVNRAHLEVMSDAIGIMQHAIGSRPDPAHGYCTDDVARALRVDLAHQRELGWAAVEVSAGRHLAFLGEAFLPSAGRFRNFRSVDGAWLDDGGSEDCQGRALLALGEAVQLAPDPRMVEAAGRLLERALPAARELVALRARASALLGCVAAVRGGLLGETQTTLRLLATRLEATFTARRDPEWPWPEPILTYENALPAQALIVAGDHLGARSMRDTGLLVLDWLVRIQTAPAGRLSPVGNGWWPRDGVRTQFDQQPIEASALVLAAHDAFTATRRTHYLRAMEQAYAWFLGVNDRGIPVAAVRRGACFDALTIDGVNLNQGAESTLVWLLALERVRQARATPPQAQRAAAPAVSLA